MENQNRPMSFFRFEDLRIYHKSLDYFNWTIEQTKNANSFDQKMVLEQLSCAAMKTAVNIAEGSSRHKLQFVNFLKDAKSTVRECVVISTMAQRCGTFTEQQLEESKEILIEITKMLGAMIVSLQRSSNRDETEPKSASNTSSEIDFEF